MLPVLQLGYRTGWPFLPHAVEGARFIAIDARVDYSATVDELGVSGRSLAESMRDTRVLARRRRAHQPPRRRPLPRALRTTIALVERSYIPRIP